MPALVRETNTALRMVILGAYSIAVVFCGAGIWLVYLGATGGSEISLFGAHLKSSSVGVASLFLGAVTVVVLVRRSLGTLDIAIKGETPSERRELPGDVWPATTSRKALEAKLWSLSETQWKIIAAVEQRDGQPVHHISAVHRPSDLYHRLRSLEADRLVTIHHGNVHLSREVKEALGRRRLVDLRSSTSPEPTATADS
jgi:hypothetical protein